ncbi:MAG: hypothetical protein WC456_00730 [Patescibacteria group bacterium]
MKRLLYLSIPIGAFAALPAAAVCPVCVVAVGAGLGLSEYLGIDNTIAGLWIGGLLVSITIWTINWLNKKNWLFGNKDLRDLIIAVLYYGLTFWPLWAQDLIGHPASRIWGVDKVVFGAIIGSLAFLAMTLWYNNIKERRGHAHFPFEKVVMPVGALIILSGVFYFLTR